MVDCIHLQAYQAARAHDLFCQDADGVCSEPEEEQKYEAASGGGVTVNEGHLRGDLDCAPSTHKKLPHDSCRIRKSSNRRPLILISR